MKIELYLDLKLTLEVDFFSQRTSKILIENLITLRWNSISKDLYFSFHYVLKKKRRSNFSFYISLYYTEVLIYRHTWPCIVKCYWSAKKQPRGSANRKRAGCAGAPVNIAYHTIPWWYWAATIDMISVPKQSKLGSVAIS